MDFRHYPSCRQVGHCHEDNRCAYFNVGYQAGIAEGEARATRAIVADLRAHEADWGDVAELADRYEAGHHLAKAEGK